MPKYLLKIIKRKWDRLDAPWLEPNKIQADPLGDLRISEGRLSVWRIEDDKSDLDLIIAALAATRQNFDKFEFALFDQELIDKANIEIEATAGKTPIERANSRHRDLVNLTVDKASELVKTIFHALEKERLLGEEIKTRVLDAAEKGNIDLKNLNRAMRNRILQHMS